MNTSNESRNSEAIHKLQMTCSAHGPQQRIILQGLETQHLILGCGCAFDLGMEDNPPYDGNLQDGSFTFKEAREAFVTCSGIEVPTEEYFKRLATIGRMIPDIDLTIPSEVRIISAEGTRRLELTPVYGEGAQVIPTGIAVRETGSDHPEFGNKDGVYRR